MIATGVEADGLLSQLADEVISSYDDYDTVENLVTALLAFQKKTTQITVGVIEPLVSQALAVEDDTILSGLLTLHNSVGGYISVNNDRELNWLDDVGEDKGQQIRYRKNLKGITKESKYGELCTRLFPLGFEDTKLSDIYVADEVGTKSFDATYGYLVLTAQYSTYLGWTGLGDALPDDLEVTSGESWIIPASDNGAADWDDPELAYDENTATRAQDGTIFVDWTTALEFTLPATVLSSKLKCYLSAVKQGVTTTTVKIEIFHTAAWHNEYEATFPMEEWFEVSYGAANVEKVKFSFNNTMQARSFPSIYEVAVFDDVGSETVLWHQGENERTLRCAILDYNGALDYRVSYFHADYLMAWDKIGAGADIISKVLTNKYETAVDSMLDATRLLLTEIKEVPISYMIDTIDLSQSEDFDFSFDVLQLGSIITVIDEDLGIDVLVREVKINRPDLLYPEKMSVELSTRVRSISDYLADLSKKFS